MIYFLLGQETSLLFLLANRTQLEDMLLQCMTLIGMLASLKKSRTLMSMWFPTCIQKILASIWTGRSVLIAAWLRLQTFFAKLKYQHLHPKPTEDITWKRMIIFKSTNYSKISPTAPRTPTLMIFSTTKKINFFSKYHYLAVLNVTLINLLFSNYVP